MSQINVWLRSKEKLFLALICCVVIVGWFVIPNVPNFFKEGPVSGGRIFDKKVSAKEVLALARCYYAILGGSTRMDPEAIAWETLILNEEAKRYGITASDADVTRWLESRFAREGGGVDAEAYVDFLRKFSLSRSDFETAIRTLSTGIRLRQTVAQSISLSENEARAWYNQRGRRVKVRYIALRANDLVPMISVEEDELKAFYEKHKNTAHSGDRPGYLDPEKVKIEYIMAPYEKAEEAAVITPEQIAAYYEANKEQYLLPAPPAGQEEPAEGEAETDAVASTETAEAEAEAADEEVSGDSAEADTEVAEGAEPQTPLASYTPLADVSEEIEKILRREEAERMVADIMQKVNDEVSKAYAVRGDAHESESIDLAAIGKLFDMDYKETLYFGRSDIPAQLQGSEGFAAKAFGQGVSSIGRPTITLTASSGKFIFQILDIQPPRPADFDAVRSQVEMDLRKEKALNVATEFAGAARSETDLNAAAKVVSARIADLLAAMPEEARREKTSEDFFTTGESSYFEQPQYWGYTMIGKTGLPGPYSYTEFARVAFALDETGVEMAIEASGPRAVYLLERADMQQPDDAEWQKNGEALTRRLLEEKRQAVMDDWWADLQRRVKPSDAVTKCLAALPEWSGSTQ